MRRFRFHPPLLLVTCCLLVGLNALFRAAFKFETRVYRAPLPQDDPAPPRLDRPWFMRGGTLRPSRPTGDSSPELWPHESGGDRIVNQLMYLPPNSSTPFSEKKTKTKTILLFQGRRGWADLPMGGAVFQRDACPVHSCDVTDDRRRRRDADLVLFKDRFTPPRDKVRPPKQIWLLFLLECPLHTQSFKSAAGLFNWTASYRHDSDIVAPYEKWVPYPPSPTHHNQQVAPPVSHAGKNKKGRVAWFVSNCGARNRRLEYARALGRHIPVDVFGKCGSKGRRKQCPRTPSCFRMLSSEYKFYLAFENSNCKDYVTEKFFVNGLGNDVLPIVMGARPEDYARAAPPNSYVHVEEFEGPAQLAAYLRLLDSNSTLYDSYFAWRGRGEFVNTRFWCRLCALLHAPLVPKVYTDLDTWWAGKGTCVNDEWREHTPTL